MGTSASSAGPGGRVPLVPPWVPDVAPTAPQAAAPAQTVPSVTVPPAQALAPLGRFRGARANLGRFVATGSQQDLRRGLGHYVRSGSGGAVQATRRMGGTVRNAGVLYG